MLSTVLCSESDCKYQSDGVCNLDKVTQISNSANTRCLYYSKLDNFSPNSSAQNRKEQ